MYREKLKRMSQNQRSLPWSDLPSDLLGLVFYRLPTRVDRAFFPAVCRQWASAARQCRLPLPSPMPWLVLPSGNVISFADSKTFQLPDGVRYHNSCGEWLLLSRDDNSCFLMNPFTKATLQLPSLSSYIYYEDPVEVSEDCMVSEDEMPGTWMHNQDVCDISVLSLVMCSTRLIAAVLAVGAIGTIALCRPGAAAWSVSAHEQCRWISDMVFLQGKLYALESITTSQDVVAIDIVDEHDSSVPRVSRIELLIEGVSWLPERNSQRWPYLLESHGTLLMICRKTSYTTEPTFGGRDSLTFVAGSSEFEVFEADFEHHLWTKVRNLGNDQALFLGQGCSRAVRVSPYDLSRHCIFFLDDCTGWMWKKITTSCGVYDMKDRKVYSPLPMVSWKSGDVPATWIFSKGET